MNIQHDTYRVTWSPEDAEHVGLCAEFASQSWLAKTPEAALKGIQKVVSVVVADMQAHGEPVPAALAEKSDSGEFRVHIPPSVHRPEGGAPTKGRHSPVGATPSSRKASQTTTHRPEGGAPTKGRRSPVGAMPSSRKASQTTTHRPEGGAPTKGRRSPVGATPSSRKSSQTTTHRPEGGAPTKMESLIADR